MRNIDDDYYGNEFIDKRYRLEVELEELQELIEEYVHAFTNKAEEYSIINNIEHGTDEYGYQEYDVINAERDYESNINDLRANIEFVINHKRG